jgi:hypothetical protein
MNEQLGVAFRLFLGVAEIAGAIGMLLPSMTRKMPWLTPVAAGCLAFVVASATVLHLSRGETGSAVTTAILFLLAAFVAYGRWRVRPIAPRGHSRSGARALASSLALTGCDACLVASEQCVGHVVEVDQEILEEYEHHMSERWPKALATLKATCEAEPESMEFLRSGEAVCP